MSLDEILKMWQDDCVIDENDLSESTISTPKLHSKYLSILLESKLRKSKITNDYNELRKMKFRYYRGELSRKELQDLNWEPWQYNKPLKNEMDEFLKGDEDLSVLISRIDYIDAIIYALDSIMSQIKQRDWQIRNCINWKQFVAGN